ncbi:helix-turn-helix domain-containing protein [Catenuloplanes atrovinosus]|uniref:Excisionase family DNA binding protein n=1 Tax=Catenuloplanes atrovinosus TaxID=137266 RepID=A0AAE4CBH7_9ACTN|nr:helix-turn-helix domain-containing protein [Catenuloplanes atrovinosus]MDR7278681.1 excisionase family DNA binding protein [Catenuloplanes atrovinosus]
MAEELLTPIEVAARLKSTTRFVRRLVSERRIAYVKVGRLVRFEPADVEAYIRAQRIEPTDRAAIRAWLRGAA